MSIREWIDNIHFSFVLSPLTIVSSLPVLSEMILRLVILSLFLVNSLQYGESYIALGFYSSNNQKISL